jgi:hypothetical protein
VGGTDSGSCSVGGFGTSVVESLGSVLGQLVSKVDLREIGYEDGRWMEPAQDRVQCRGLALEVLNPQEYRLQLCASLQTTETKSI